LGSSGRSAACAGTGSSAVPSTTAITVDRIPTREPRGLHRQPVCHA
jgi:hypothetical protein